MGEVYMSKAVEKENEEKHEPVVEEFYRWIGRLESETIKQLIYVTLRFINDLLVSLEIQMIFEKQGIATKSISLSAESEDPEDYFETVIEFVQKLIQRFEVVREDYEAHASF
jgi:hypothetical protein